MKAVGFYRNHPITEAESLLDLEVPVPTPGPRDLLVAVKAVAVNPVDYKVRSRPTDELSVARVLGYDAAGIVEAVGSEVSLFQPGDRVYYAGDVTRQGSNAQYQLVDERIVGVMPNTLNFAQAAALPLTAITAWESFFERLHIDPNGKDAGKTLLIVGGAGGVGSIGIQLAKQLAKLQVVATASRPESEAWCRELGADHVINHHGDLIAQSKALGLDHYDFIACFNETDRYFPVLAKLIRPQGTIVTIVESKQPIEYELLKMKSAAIAWEFMFTRSMFTTPDMIEQHYLLNRIAELIDAGVLKTTVADVLGPINAHNLKRAHAALESGSVIGKLVLNGF